MRKPKNLKKQLKDKLKELAKLEQQYFNERDFENLEKVVLEHNELLVKKMNISPEERAKRESLKEDFSLKEHLISRGLGKEFGLED